MKASHNMEHQNGKMKKQFSDDRSLFKAPPADYFEDLPDVVMQRLPRRSEKTEEGRRTVVWRRWAPALVTLVLLAVILWVKVRQPFSSPKQAQQEWTMEDEVLYNWEDDDLLMEELASSDDGQTSYLILMN